MTREQAIDHLCARAYARDLIGDHKTAQAIGILVETMGEITALGKELRTFRGGITDENTLVGFNMAVALCNKHLGEKGEKYELGITD